MLGFSDLFLYSAGVFLVPVLPWALCEAPGLDLVIGETGMGPVCTKQKREEKQTLFPLHWYFSEESVLGEAEDPTPAK